VTSERFDVVVVGCGAAGAATAWWCARRGLSVLAVDRFEPGHRRGSSHGTERIVRLGHTDTDYVRFAIDALEGWREVESCGGVPLLSPTGAVDLGLASELDEIEACSTGLGVSMERLDAAEAARRYPGMRFSGDVLFHADGGTVHADRAVSVLRRLAAQSGAVLRPVAEVTAVTQLADGVAVQVEHERVLAGSAVVTTGAWAPRLLEGVVPLPGYRVTKEQLAFFRPHRSMAWPTFIDRAALRHYGMTTPEGLVKVAEHHTGPVVDPDRRTYDLEPTTWERLVGWVRDALPGVEPTPVDSSTCLYASTVTEDFVLDRTGDIVVGIGLSGHGFKFVPAIGRRLADLADGTGWPSNPFAIGAQPHLAGASGHK
jgi:sarcosine oxidase